MAVAINRQRARGVDIAGDFAFAQDDRGKGGGLGGIDVDLPAAKVGVFQRRNAARAREQAPIGVQHGLVIHGDATPRISRNRHVFIRNAPAEGLD